ncbi:MAG: hypothetical protein M3M99_05410 [Actinomycetota bacterium]|nr:hypothetical protein [Actinomycetota bacterium]
MPRTTTVLRVSATTAAVAVIALASVVGESGGAAPIAPKKGEYRGKTAQQAVASSARQIAFKLKGKKISLTAEPLVARNFCVSPPVFLLDVASVSTKFKGNRFKFTSTFIGSKMDKISGRFVSSTKIEGEVLYHFPESASGLCGAGTTRISFSAKRK